MLLEWTEQLIHLNLLNVRSKTQQHSSIHIVFCLMLGDVFVNISIHHSLAWRKIGMIDANKGSMVTLQIYYVTSKDSCFTGQDFLDNLSGTLSNFATNIKSNCQKIILSFVTTFHLFEKTTFFRKGACYRTKQSLLYN